MKRKHSILFLVPALALTLVLCYSLARVLLIVIPQKQEADGFSDLKRSALAAHSERPDAPTRPDEAPDPDPAPDADAGTDEATGYPYELLAQQNGDFAGWLSIPDTAVDYPVMKPPEDEPEYYLRRDFYGNKSLSGCLFIGKGCDADSESFIIYGHNMNTGAMFGTLDRYADYEYAVAHPELRFSAPDGERIYRVFAAFQTRIDDDRDDLFRYYEAVGTLGREAYEQTAETLRAMSILSLPCAPAYPQQLLLLSTCSYHTENGRFVVAAYRTDL